MSDALAAMSDEPEADEPLLADEPEAVAAEEPFRVQFVANKQFAEARRLDQYVVSRMPDLSRAEVQRVIASGLCTVNGTVVKASYRIRQGDVIDLELAARFADKPLPQYIPLDIIYEDEFMVILNKQANLIVHPGRGKENWTGTLTNALQYHFDQLSQIGGANRPGIVHRLDRDTTGVILVAKDDLAHKNLGLQFEHRKVQKEYVALCYGVPELDRDVIDRPIGPHPSVREKMAIRDDPKIGKPAQTFYEVIERFDGYSYIRCRPTTGRTHQIRVHLAHVGIPIIADKPYAARSELRRCELEPDLAEDADAPLIGRQALHARRITFRHPRCHEVMDVEVPLPPDMEQTLAALRSCRPYRGQAGRR